MRSHLIVVLAALLLYVGLSTYFASRKPLWLDEVNGITLSTRADVSDLFLRGAQEQASPAPLYYIFAKGGAVLKKVTTAFGIPATVSWRWSALLPFVVGGFLFLSRRSSLFSTASMQSVFLLLFLFSKSAFRQSYEARPYAMWLMLSFLFLVCVAEEEKPWYWPLVCVSLALTATASIFQLAAFAALFWVWAWRQKINFKSVAQVLWPVGLGIATALYYCPRAEQFGYFGDTWGSWKDFGIMVTKHFAPIIGVGVLIARHWKSEQPQKVVVWLTVAMWYAMSPLIFMVTRSQGFFFHDRQYIYWSASAVFVLFGIYRLYRQNNWTWETNKVRFSMLLVLLLLCFDRVGPYHPFVDLFRK